LILQVMQTLLRILSASILEDRPFVGRRADASGDLRSDHIHVLAHFLRHCRRLRRASDAAALAATCVGEGWALAAAAAAVAASFCWRRCSCA
jgi:hypothetical protein